MERYLSDGAALSAPSPEGDLYVVISRMIIKVIYI